MEEKRLVNYDVLRILSAFLIVVLHLSVDYKDEQVLSALCRSGVPLFIMISGLFMLDPSKELTTSLLVRKYLAKIGLIFLVWSAFYACIDFGIFSFEFDTVEWDLFFRKLLLGHYHMWYLYMLAGLYLITPFLRLLTTHGTPQLLSYFLVLCVGFTSLTKLNNDVLQLPELGGILERISMNFVFGYVGYYLAGYYFGKQTLSKKAAYTIYSLGILSLAIMIYGQDRWVEKSILFSNYSPTVFLLSFAIFLFFSRWKSQRRAGFLLRKVPGYTLVIYLVHPYLYGKAGSMGLLMAPTGSLSLLINAGIVFIISLFVSLVLSELWRKVKVLCTF